jgi:hypothetical protein
MTATPNRRGGPAHPTAASRPAHPPSPACHPADVNASRRDCLSNPTNGHLNAIIARTRTGASTANIDGSNGSSSYPDTPTRSARNPCRSTCAARPAARLDPGNAGADRAGGACGGIGARPRADQLGVALAGPRVCARRLSSMSRLSVNVALTESTRVTNSAP